MKKTDVAKKMKNGDVDWVKNAQWAAVSRREKAYHAQNKIEKAKGDPRMP